MIFKFLKKYFNNTPTRLLARKSDFKKLIEFDYSPIETSVVFGKRLLKPVDIFSTIMYLINKEVLCIDNSKIKKTSTNVILIQKDFTENTTLTSHEKFILDYLKSFSENKNDINIKKINDFFSKKNYDTKDSLKTFFAELNLIVEKDLIDKSLIIKPFSKNKKAIISVSTLFILLFRNDFAYFIDNLTILPSSLLLNFILLIIFSGFIINYLYSKANIKPNPFIKNDFKTYRYIKSKFFILKKIIGKDFDISFENSLFFSSRWFSLDSFYNTNYGFFKDMLFSFRFGTIKSRDLSKRLFINFTNMVSNLSRQEPVEKTNSTLYNKKYILKTSNDEDIGKKSALESYITKRLNVNERLEANNLVIFKIFELTINMEKSYFK